MDDKQKVINCIEERVGCNLQDLKEITDIIYESYKNKFSSQQLYGESNFPIISQNTFHKDKNSYWTLSEKCIRRQYDLNELEQKLKANDIISKDLEEAKTLTNIIERLIPLEIFWAMEEQKEDDYAFNEHEQKCYDYLEEVATYYLDETQSLVEKFYDNKLIIKNKKYRR